LGEAGFWTTLVPGGRKSSRKKSTDGRHPRQKREGSAISKRISRDPGRVTVNGLLREGARSARIAGEPERSRYPKISPTIFGGGQHVDKPISWGRQKESIETTPSYLHFKKKLPESRRG